MDYSEEKMDRLGAEILKVIDEFSEHERLTTGEAMGALFGVMVESAKASPQYDPKKLIEEVSARIREATELQ